MSGEDLDINNRGLNLYIYKEKGRMVGEFF